LELPKEDLHHNINARVDSMIQKGLIEEARSLIPYRQLNALQTVGYKEIFGYFNQEATLPEAIGSIKKNTRQYAKRQVTWFRKDKEFIWFPPDTKKIKQVVNQHMAAR
jgi:tRNA dimethylallyltransferase